MSRLTQARGLKRLASQLRHEAEQVAPHAGAWIETVKPRRTLSKPKSRLTQARGLKQFRKAQREPLKPSRLTQARGLKQAMRAIRLLSKTVAPHAGAWIETSETSVSVPTVKVAPHAGAWIETGNSYTPHGGIVSRLTQARGLKLPAGDACTRRECRASRRRVD